MQIVMGHRCQISHQAHAESLWYAQPDLPRHQNLPIYKNLPHPVK